MTIEQIKAGLLSLEPTHPFYLAILAVLNDDVESEVDAVAVPGLTDSARQFNAGRLAHARDIRRAIEGVVMEAAAEHEAWVNKAKRQQERQPSEG